MEEVGKRIAVLADLLMAVPVAVAKSQMYLVPTVLLAQPPFPLHLLHLSVQSPKSEATLPVHRRHKPLFLLHRHHQPLPTSIPQAKKQVPQPRFKKIKSYSASSFPFPSLSFPRFLSLLSCSPLRKFGISFFKFVPSAVGFAAKSPKSGSGIAGGGTTRSTCSEQGKQGTNTSEKIQKEESDRA